MRTQEPDPEKKTVRVAFNTTYYKCSTCKDSGVIGPGFSTCRCGEHSTTDCKACRPDDCPDCDGLEGDFIEPCCGKCGAMYCHCHREADVRIPLTKPEVSHYRTSGIEPIDLIDVNDLDFFRGNIVKYAIRLDKKGDPRGDVDKLVQYSLWLKEKVYRGDYDTQDR